jgi:hypothetical protein
MIDDKERAGLATMETGGAHALARVAAHYLDCYDQDSDHLQVAAHLLGEASRLADHAALLRRRIAREADAAVKDGGQ